MLFVVLRKFIAVEVRLNWCIHGLDGFLSEEIYFSPRGLLPAYSVPARSLARSLVR